MDLDEGGWTLVWKHSYFEVNRANLMKMKTSSMVKEPCVDLKQGWCNEPVKKLRNARQQMVAAYHNERVVYPYKER